MTAGTWLMRWFRPALMMGAYAVINIALMLVGILHPGLVGGCALLATSFFMSIMYLTIFALGVKDLGPKYQTRGLVDRDGFGGSVDHASHIGLHRAPDR